jgi:hypothetical protein
VPRVEARDRQPATAQLMHQSWVIGTRLDTNARVLSTMPLHCTRDLLRVGGALTAPQSATGIVDDAVNSCDTSKPT